jgi:hypothetical protein
VLVLLLLELVDCKLDEEDEEAADVKFDPLLLVDEDGRWIVKCPGKSKKALAVPINITTRTIMPTKIERIEAKFSQRLT